MITQQCFGLIIAILLFVIWKAERRDRMLVSTIDGHAYNVLEYLDNPYTAANKLAKINKYVHKLNRSLLTDYSKNTHEYKLGLRMQERYNPRVLFENAPKDITETSYTDGKGMSLAVCLRQDSKEFEDIEIINFVTTHELAHIVSVEYGHGYNFWYNFKILLQCAEKANLHTPINYEKNPDNYCGLELTYSPYFDETL